MRSKSIKKIIRKLSRKIICVNDSRYIKFKNFSILIGIFIFIILSTVSDVGAATVGKTIISAPTDPLRNGLVGWWTFDGNNMINNVADSSGSGNNGMMSGFISTSSAVTAGKVGQGLRFDGSNDYVNITDSDSISPTSAVTISTWMRINESQTSSLGIVTKGPDSADYDYMLYMSNNGAAFWFFMKNSVGTSDFTPQYNFDARDGKWHLYTATFDGDIMRLYIDKTLVSSKDTALTDVRDSSQPLRLGRGWGNYIKGSLDDARVYSRALSLTEIQQLYSQGSAKVASTISRPAQTGLSSGLVGHWTFDGKNMVSNVADSSGSGNNGKMSGFTSTSSAVTAGKVGQGLRFDGSNDYVSANSSAMTYPLTLSAWVKLDAVPSVNNTDRIPVALAKTSGLEEFWIGFYRTSGGVNVLRSVAQSGADLRTYSANLTMDTKWHHVTAVFTNSSTHALYYDGVAQSGSYGTGGTGTPTPSGLDTLYISGFYYNTSNFYSPFLGTIDDVRVYNRTLSDTEIKQLYSQGSARVASTISRPAQTGLSSGLVGHWTFDGKNMISNVADSSGNGNNGMMSGFISTSSAVTAGKVGQGLRFDGVDDYVSIADHSSLEGMSSLTISAWVKAVNTGTGADQDILNKGDVGLVPYALRVSGSTGKMNFYVANSSAFANPVPISNSIIPFGIWSHFVGTYDGSTAKLYLNGQLQTTAGSLTGNVNTNSSILAIGRQGPSNARYVSGSLDDVRVYNRALSASEVQQLYNMSK